MADRAMTEDERATHREQIDHEHERFIGSLDWFVDKLYVSHFTDVDLRGSSDYTTIVEAADRLKQLALVKYTPGHQATRHP